MKIKKLCDQPSDIPNMFLFHCPGCKIDHWVRYSGDKKPCWKWNNSESFSTVTPSLLNKWDNPRKICHLYITNGQIIYLNDCTHDLVGQTVDMLEFDWDK